jgi:fused signal recognition particle receptor
MGFFKKISQALKKTKESFSRKLDYIISGGELNDEFYEELTDILISTDMGYETAETVTENLRQYARINKLKKSSDVKNALKIVIKEIIDTTKPIELKYPAVITMVGVNGTGKTTTIGKLTNYFVKDKKQVVLVAADTFRAGATDQLNVWAERNKVRIIKHEDGSDPAAVVFDGVKSAKANKTDVLLVDTAGRLHTKTNLMVELEKIGKILEREYQEANKYTFLVLDATVGQNAISQLENFKEYIDIDGIVLTKLDGTAKGGVVVAIAKQTGLPVAFVGLGEGIDDIEEFCSQEFVENMF